MQCVILAAGSGSRLSSLYNSKPLLPVLGVPLIERNIRSISEAGITDFIVVTGHRAQEVQSFLQGLAARLGLSIRCIHNAEWDTSENGRSVLAAEPEVKGAFLLAMADHLVEPALVRQLAGQRGDAVLTLGVDYRLDNPSVDRADVTRVRDSAGCLEAIGKGLESFNGWDTGFFLCRRPAVFFEILRQVCAEGHSRLTDAVARLAEERQVQTVDMGDHYWNDVDSPRQLKLAEQWLLDRSRGKRRDGFVARYLNRPLSIRLSRYLAETAVTPTQISLISFVMSLQAAILLGIGAAATLTIGGVLAQFASIIDGCDGEIARLKHQESEYGGWLDAVLDRYADAALLVGLTWALSHTHGNGAWLLGSLALAGSFMVSYTADKYDNWVQQQNIAYWRIGRDLRVLLIAIAAISGWVMEVLVLIAVVMNGEALRRVWVLRPKA